MVNKTDTAADLVAEARRKLSVAKADAQEAESRLEKARERVQKYQNFLSVLGEFTGNGSAALAGEDRVGGDREERELSDPNITIAEAAEVVLRRAGEPLKNRKIAERMVADGYKYDKDITKLRNSVGTILDRKAGKNDTFQKHAPGFFGLLEWENGNA